MSVYVITGVSKGIGFELVRQISEDTNTLVIGLVRDKAATEKKASLKQAAADTAQIIGDRGVDYLVANGAFPSHFDAYDPIGNLATKPQELEAVCSKLFQTNVVGNIHLFNLFLPSVMQGKVKKVIAISSGHADLDLINALEVENSALYAASKAAMNTIVAKFSAQYKRDGVLFVAVSPGVVEVGHYENVLPEQIEGLQRFMGKIAAYAPHFKGLTPVAEAVRTLRETWERLSIEGGFAGAFVSHFGNKQWL
ncbi:uncharacterized protein DSM5745_10709 [Aspergillus mulundensis]|uniref:Short chain dehydrogenase n=1 Tax=Aspergillus mulundensis TaxID=1810919 RepID=A0A3D8QHL3_9EURO|nr:Uncharacterized protein DSM5745_10709 [Aspergillus mulundensis]RDW61211.1 Uncharacterized protein DSM5745_10709 [Aspergillus mulundensis]